MKGERKLFSRLRFQGWDFPAWKLFNLKLEFHGHTDTTSRVCFWHSARDEGRVSFSQLHNTNTKGKTYKSIMKMQFLWYQWRKGFIRSCLHLIAQCFVGPIEYSIHYSMQRWNYFLCSELLITNGLNRRPTFWMSKEQWAGVCLRFGC